MKSMMSRRYLPHRGTHLACLHTSVVRLCAGMRLLCKCCSRCVIVFNRHHCAAQVRCERRYGMAHAGASRCIAARCHRYGVSHRMSHTQDGGRVHVSSRQHAPRACTPPWPLLNFTVKNHLTGVWCNVNDFVVGFCSALDASWCPVPVDAFYNMSVELKRYASV